ncbi:MAG: hypothetical protein RL413_2054 [Actinomycetota bacterium]
MGFPHPTLDVPGDWPAVLAELDRLQAPDERSRDLRRLLATRDRPSPRPDDVMPAHICATAWVLSPDGEHAIFVRHKTLGWSTPGGHVEIGENTHDAARRELEEETGLTRFDTRLIGNGPAVVHTTDTNNPRDHRHWNVGWLMTADMDAPLSPVEGARWFACDRLPDGPPDIAATLPILRTLLARDTP